MPEVRVLYRASVRAIGVALLAALGTACAYLPATANRDGGTGRAASATTSYYVSPAGNDAAAGTSPATAWKTLTRASKARLRPGTRLLLQGSATYVGQLKIGPGDGGDAKNPVFIGSYGTGPATISGTGSAAVSITNTAGLVIDGLDISGPGRSDLRAYAGINVLSNLKSTRRLAGITISYVRVHGYDYGISVGSSNTLTGFTSVSIADCVLYDNTFGGLTTFGPTFNPARPYYAVEDVSVSHVTAYDNSGTPKIKAYSTGNGIVLGSVNHASVMWSTAYRNGALDGSLEGPEGIWAYNSTHVFIAHDVSFANRTDGYRLDGDGFGLDENTSHSVLEYDLSFGNDGSGYTLYAPANNGATTANTVRFNISSGDGVDGNPQFGGVTVLGYEKNASIYQNTVVLRSSHQFGLVLGPKVQGITARNNILANLSGPAVSARGPLSRTAALLQGNDYYTPPSQPLAIWYRTAYSSLTDWRAATGQERVHGRPSGLAANPRLRGRVLGLPANRSASLTLGSSFALRRGSPVRGHGLSLVRLFGIDPGRIYFSGARMPSLHPDIGAQ